MEKNQAELRLRPEQQGLVVLDVFAAHHVLDVLNAFHEANMLQLLDLSVNGKFKAILSNCFTDWYTNEVAEIAYGEGIDSDDAAEAVMLKVDLQLLHLKPIHANWLVKAVDSVTLCIL